jgi:hypothetical protein
MKRRLCWIFTAVSLAAPVCAQAQAAQAGEPASSVYVGVGEVTLYRGDLDVRHAPGGEAGARVALSPRVRLDVAIGQFRNHQSVVVFDVPISSPTAALGRADRLDQRTDHTTSLADVTALSTGRIGRLGIAGGGGAGIIVLGRRFRQRLTGCSSGATQFCTGETGTDFTSTSATAIGLATLDIRVTSRVSVYGAGRFVLVLRDVGSSGLRATGGVRIGL